MKFDVNQFYDMPADLREFSGSMVVIVALLFLALRIRSPRFFWLATILYFAALVLSFGFCLYIGHHGVDWRWSRSDFEVVQSRAVDVLIAGGVGLANVGAGILLFRRQIAATRR
jgi:hypothetical protein